MSSGVLGGLTVAAVIATLAYASYRDVVSREVHEVLWAPAYALAVLNAVLGTGYSAVGIALALSPAAVYGALYAFKLLGGADLLAMALVALAHLDEPLVPLTTFVLSSLAPLPLVLANLVRNALVDREAMESIACARGSKRLLYLVGRPITVAEFLEKRFAFLHTYPSKEGLVCTSEVDVDVDFEKQRTDLAEAVREGLVDSGDYVIYSPAIPHIALIALSYSIAAIAIHYLRALAPLP